ncbi:MAG: hypothetical protein U0X40_08115 [Ferruginibacter sp.]
MKFYLLLLSALLVAACKHPHPVPAAGTKTTMPPTVAVSPVNYDSCKELANRHRRELRPLWSKMTLAQKERMFTGIITKYILPAWTGTPWSFNGTSEKPQQGSIACGYFVTTVLRDAGLPLARARLAQCASEDMIRGLINRKCITRFSNVPLEEFIAAVKQGGYGLYIVGLDNHTGFIYNDGNTVRFIHSTFVGTRNVQQENASMSWVLRQSRYKVLGKLSADEALLNRWEEGNSK